MSKIRHEGGGYSRGIRSLSDTRGEDPRFFVVLEGSLQAVKDIVGQHRKLDQVKADDFFGEIPILLGTANLVSMQALTGIFCAGDVRHGSIKRVASDVGEGSMSIAFIHQYLVLIGRPDLTLL